MRNYKFYGRDVKAVALQEEKKRIKAKQREQSLVNLNKLDVHVLTKELIEKYNQNNDTGIIKSFFQKKKVEGQEKALDALLDLIRTIRQNSNSIIEYKAHLAIQQDLFEIIAEGKITEAELMAAKTKAMLEADLFRQQLDKEKAQAELDSMLIENKRAEHEAEKVSVGNRIMSLRGDLIEKIIKELDFANLDMKQVFVLIEMVKEVGANDDLFAAEARWEQLKAEAKKTNAQADQEVTKADWEKFKFEQESKPPNV